MTVLKPKFTRVLHRNDVGSDVEGVSRAYIRAGYWPTKITVFEQLPLPTRRTFDLERERAQKRLEKELSAPIDGIYGRPAFEVLKDANAFDAKACRLLDQWKPDPPPLIAPKQGFDSLHKSMWRIYSDCIRLGGFDLGTYNPASRLPSGKISDHATSVDFATQPSRPAKAIDFGIDPDTGWNNVVGRAIFNRAMADPDVVEYVILGDKIGFPSSGKIEKYTAGGHMNHVHISGHRKS